MNYIIFDLEATCERDNSSYDKETIEIGAVKVSKVDNVITAVSEFSAFIKPVKNPKLTDFCKELMTITQKDVDNAKLFPEVMEEFERWIGQDDFTLCSWGFYDLKQLKKDSKRHNISSKWLEGRHISLKHQHGQIVGVRPMGMAKALRMINKTIDGTHHRGIDDARNIAKVFLHYYGAWEMPNGK